MAASIHLIQNVASVAHKLFSRLNPVSGNFKEHAKDLIQLVNKITCSDLNFQKVSVSNGRLSQPFYKNQSAPCSYCHIWEDHVMSVGIFVIHQGASIPLHNHPRMNGICKVLHGTLRLKSFTPLTNLDYPKLEKTVLSELGLSSDSVLPVYLEEDRLVMSGEDCCVLTHNRGNIHEISSVEGDAAFLDILAPPYDHERGTRVCQYYKELPHVGKFNDMELYWLGEISCPTDFWCDEIQYSGPEIVL